MSFENFFMVVVFKRLMAMHLHDSKIELGSRKDRHEKIGEGLLGIEAFKNLMEDDRLDDLPFVLETPDPEAWKKEIALLYSMIL